MDTSSLLDFKNRRFRVVLRLTLVVAVLFYVMYRIIYKPTLFDSPIWSGYKIAGNEYFPTFSVMNPNKKELFVSITKNAINYCSSEKERLFFMNNPQIKSIKVEDGLWWVLYHFQTITGLIGVANSLDDAFTNTQGKSLSQQLVSEEYGEHIGIAKTSFSVVSLGCDMWGIFKEGQIVNIIDATNTTLSIIIDQIEKTS